MFRLCPTIWEFALKLNDEYCNRFLSVEARSQFDFSLVG